MGFPAGASGKEPACQCRRPKRCGFNPWVRKIPWRGAPQPTPAFLPGESSGQRSLAGYSPWGPKELDAIERLSLTHSCIFWCLPGGSMVRNLPANARDVGLIPGLGRSPGEGNGNPLQYSCLGNPMDRGAWQATSMGSQRVRHD